jgi:hypothetical protein
MEGDVFKTLLVLFCLVLIMPVEAFAAESIAAADTVVRRRAARPPAPPQTSTQLIDAAFASGEISQETTLVYRVFADFDDDRLPVKFRGTAESEMSSNAAALVVAHWNRLSAESQSLLLPFVVPPFTEGSWADERRKSAHGVGPLDLARCSPANVDDWEARSVTGPGGKVFATIWFQKRYPEDEAAFVQPLMPVVLDAITKFEALLGGRELLPDKGSTRPGCRGRDDSIDIVLVDKRSSTIPFGADKTPSFINLNRAPTKQSMKAEMVHELFHAFQYTYDAHDGWWAGWSGKVIAHYKWLMEATAQWAMHYVSPAGNSGEEQNALKYYLDATKHSLNKPPKDEFNYGTYIFFLYLTEKHGNDIIRKLWEAVATESDELEVVDKVVPGKLKEVWPKFALELVNEGKFDLMRKDGISRSASVEKMIVMNDGGSENFEDLPLRDSPVAHMSARYYRITPGSPLPRWIGFVNGLTFSITKRPVVEAGIPYHSYYFDDSDPDIKKSTRVYLVTKTGGVWRETELTHVPFDQLCRDVSFEKVEEMVLVVANSDKKIDGISEKNLPFVFIFSNIACSEWKGNTTFNFKEECTVVMQAEFESSLKRMPGMAGVELISVGEATMIPPLFFSGTLTGGTWRASGTNGHECKCTVSGNSDVAGFGVQGVFALYPWAPPGSKNVRRSLMNLM